MAVMATTPFGERLKELRDRAGWSQQDLATEAGLGIATVAKLERGVTDPSWSTVTALAKALGMDVSAFSGTVAPPPKTPKRRKPRRS